MTLNLSYNEVVIIWRYDEWPQFLMELGLSLLPIMKHHLKMRGNTLSNK